MKKIQLQILCSCLLLSSICNASELHYNVMTPEAVNRTFIQNFKDMVFASCIAKAYKDDGNARIDAGSSAHCKQLDKVARKSFP